MTTEHYPRPSGAAGWIVCTGLIEMRRLFPEAPDEADSEVTEDGTACHWLASEMWEGRHPQLNTLAINGRVITEEMFEGVDMYHGVLRSWPNVAPVCEQSIPIDDILRGMTGTPDAWAYNPDTKTLYIADLKFGFRFVEVWENWQLVCYAVGLMRLLGLDWNTTNIEFVIVQPRSYHRDGPVRVWRTPAAAIMPQVQVLQAAARKWAEGVIEYVPNPQCLDCPGRHVCVAYQNASMRAVEVAYGGGDTHELSPAALGAELRLLKDAAKKLEGRISGLEVQAEDALRKGAVIPGWVLTASYARETWREGTEQEVMTLASRYFNVDVRKPAKAITPNQARKMLPSGIVAIYSHKPSTGVRLTKQDPYEAKKAFSK